MSPSLPAPASSQWRRRAVLGAGWSAVLATACRPLALAATAARNAGGARKIEPA